MPQIIAETYELENQIGAGGGGVVYLGRHTRLNKPVVLKADKRKLSVGEEKLRREVDLLKGLSHTYIPQVYDFVQEGETVYTVMDYIDGESLDKVIGRGTLPSQPDVVKWACQLLEALHYLHSQPPYGILHGDIKPANIMVRPNGDVCLIDFNIALALGEEGAVRVGFSRGYASPEHYGADYIRSNKAAAVKTGTTLQSRGFGKSTSEADDDKTLIDKSFQKPSSIQGTSGSQKGILLDVRSDIYSLGATLYHLISGQRPDPDARAVVPLDKSICSEAVSRILQKAMNPQPDERYQTAKEMLNAFLRLHKNDPRAVRHRRHMITAAAFFAIMLLAGASLIFIGLKQMQQRENALALAEYSANAFAAGDISGAVENALAAIPKEKSIFNAPVTANAQRALADALGVYDLSQNFKPLDALALPGAPFDFALSPGGTRLAVVYAYETAVFDLEKLKELAVFPTQQSALSDCAFLDETRLVYAGEDGLTCADVKTGKTIWKAEIATTLAVSADKSTIAAVDRDSDYASFYSAQDGKKIAERSFDGLHLTVPANDIFADAKNDIFALNADGSMLAISFSNGGFVIYDCENPDNDLIIYDESGYDRFSGGFCGKYFAYAANKDDGAQFGIIDAKEGTYAGGYDAEDEMMIQADENGVYLAVGRLIEKIDTAAMAELEMAYLDADIASFAVRHIAGKEYTLAASRDNRFMFYDSGAGMMSADECSEICDFTILGEGFAVLGNRSDPSLRVLSLDKGDKEALFTYDARYAHDEARVSRDKNTMMLFSYQGFRVYAKDEKLIADVELPDSDNIYDQQFESDKDSSWLEVIWYDGTRRQYSAADGAMIKETKGEAPDKSLVEEFETDKYRIVSELHSAPAVYSASSGKKVATLETEDFLTYVSQFGDCIITEYISAQGGRYGLLLNDKLQTIAVLDGLCDISGDKLVFDYGDGNMRQSRLYSLEELTALGEKFIKKQNKLKERKEDF